MSTLERIVGVVSANNEVKTVPNVIRQLGRAGVEHVIVVCNGCEDGTLSAILRMSPMPRPKVRTLWFRQALGHDVPRGIGVLEGLRAYGSDASFLLVDGDFGGSFGPMLSDFLTFAIANKADVVGIGQPRMENKLGRAMQPWRVASAAADNDVFALPFVFPQFIAKGLFQSVSPLWLCHPGAWYAATLRHGFRWLAYPEWDMAMVGHRNRSERHQSAMLQRIEDDGHLALAWMSAKATCKPRRLEGVGLPRRRFDIAVAFAAQMFAPLS